MGFIRRKEEEEEEEEMEEEEDGDEGEEDGEGEGDDDGEGGDEGEEENEREEEDEGEDDSDSFGSFAPSINELAARVLVKGNDTESDKCGVCGIDMLNDACQCSQGAMELRSDCEPESVDEESTDDEIINGWLKGTPLSQSSLGLPKTQPSLIDGYSFFVFFNQSTTQ